MGEQPTPSAAGRPRSRRGQGERLRTEILAAVDRLLVEWGSAEKLTIRAVAREAGVAAPSIYLHFPDKAELVWAALEGKYAELAALMRAADAAAEAGGPAGRLRAQVHAYCRFALVDPGHYRLMYEVRQPAVDAERIRRHPARLVSGSLRQALACCRDAGLTVSLPVEQAAHTLWAGLHGIVSLSHTLSPDLEEERLLLGLADGLLGSLLPGDAAARAALAEHGDPGVLRVIHATVLDPQAPVPAAER
ncbi:TetR/AcrR family transcriptional regulator [Streptantibioticus silvisoli]|uniref:TetR/AcrR family transcriptional regulator n=1 Tax=Streptantibioticus silvisoli TaxID=2705255 RepID=A0ABT6W7Q4_9ACTN|nr:TetR/AcrR family transcriptional regulator [Streptantibioticus silvisoli]MDI5966780.1 TetR/AcrR family transcriptional regulator [Streptantibioticus silvisoli]